MLHEIFNQSGSRTFMQVNHRLYSYQWLQERIRKLLTLFDSLGLSRTDRVVLAVSDDAEMSALFLASLVAGVTAVIADPEMKAPRAQAILRRCDPRAIIADEGILQQWQLGSGVPYTILPVRAVQQSR